MNENWYKDIMAQKYQYDNYFDPTKLFIALAFIETGKIKQRYPIKEIAQYVYRYYIANLDIARHNFNIVVRNIKNMGLMIFVCLLHLQLINGLKNKNIILCL